MPAAITFPLLLKQCRLELGLTQTQLAVRAGISVSLVRKYETGARMPPRATAVQLANALELVGEERTAFLAAAGSRTLPNATIQPILAMARPLAHHLPVAPTPLLGRDTEIAELIQLIGAHTARCVTLIGPPGVGNLAWRWPRLPRCSRHFLMAQR